MHFSFIGKIESTNKTLDNITRDILLNSGHKKILWFFPYQYAVWISRLSGNIFHGIYSYYRSYTLLEIRSTSFVIHRYHHVWYDEYIYHLFIEDKHVEIKCKLIPSWIKLTRAWIVFTAQCRAGYKNQIRNTTWKSISIYHIVITLTLFRYFYWNPILSL